MATKVLVCVDCGQEFVFGEKEQEFFAEKGFQLPKRCKDCRRYRRQQRQEKEAIQEKS